MRVIIAGAGIGGLSTALSLHAAGFSPVVVDCATKLRALGVGINLQPHAVRELTELGLGTELAALAVPTAEFVHFDRFGTRIWGEPRGLAAGYRWPQYSVHRGELQLMLAAAVRARHGDEAIRTGTAVVGFSQDSSAVHVQVRDRASGGLSTLTGDALIGADGLHSAVRALLHPGEGDPLWNGIRMWRGVVETEPYLTGRSLAVAGSNTASKFVAYPISRAAEERGRSLVNWVAEVRDGAMAEPADWNRAGRLDDVLPYFARWRFDWLDIPGLLKATAEILEYPMVDRNPLPWWTRGRVTLLGDAAHPMYPIGSNGGSQAILDARVLAHELARTGSVAEGLAGYEALRREPTSAIVLANRAMPGEKILRTVAERAPAGFKDISDVLSAAELDAFTSAYTATTGSDARALNERPSWTPPAR